MTLVFEEGGVEMACRHCKKKWDLVDVFQKLVELHELVTKITTWIDAAKQVPSLENDTEARSTDGK
jgi:hypothetical protein